MLFPSTQGSRRFGSLAARTGKSAALTAVMVVMVFGASDIDEYRRDQRRDLEAYRERQRADITSRKQELAAHVARTRTEYEQWRREQNQELARFRHAIKRQWGAMRKQAPHLWVEYSADTQSVAAVDFREGEVAVSVLLDANATEQTVRKRMATEVTRILVSKGGGALAPIARPEAGTAFDRPLLRELVRTRHGLYRDSMDAPVVARDILDSADIRIGAVAEQDESPRAATVRFRLAPDYIRRLMRPYVSLVRKYSARFDVDPAMVLAMIHTESHFNPVARSSANALGLMQLVPDDGGRDAYAYVTGEDRIPLDDYFLDPENNIRLGCAYVYLLKTRHFGKVLDPNSNRYCTIAGYNTGPGNVAYAFTGKRSLRPAVAVINRMSDHQEVYSFMIRNLPYRQTRRYLQKVVSRMAAYAEANL